MTTSKPMLTKTDRNLWNAIVGEAMANLKYNAFAHKALEEGLPEVAQVFQEVAGAETIHGINHLRVAGSISSTEENLRGVITEEAKEASTLYPRMIKDSLDEGRFDAAETLTIAMDREQHHIAVFGRALDQLLARKAERDALTIETPAFTESESMRLHQLDAHPATSTAYRAASQELENERWRVAAFGRIREVVFGAQDGLLSTVALVTSIAVADVGGTTTILVAGLAASLAGMISMSTGAYLSSKAEQDVQQAEIAKEAAELEAHPAEELAELVVIYQREGMSMREARNMAEHIASDKDLWLRTLVEKELGLSPDTTSNPLKDALTMGVAFIVAAIIPILPYFFLEGGQAIWASVASALAGLFALGVGKGRLVQKSPLLQGLEILAIGGAAAGLGYLLGLIIPAFFTAA